MQKGVGIRGLRLIAEDNEDGLQGLCRKWDIPEKCSCPETCILFVIVRESLMLGLCLQGRVKLRIGDYLINLMNVPH